MERESGGESGNGGNLKESNLMRYFNDLNESYERIMLARAEPEKERTMEKPKDAEVYDWDKFVEWAEISRVSLNHGDDYGPWWDCWKEGYTAGVESTAENE